MGAKLDVEKQRVADLLQRMAQDWGSPIVVRSQVGIFSGHTISPRYMANLDSAGKGPSIRIRCGRKIAYPIDTLVEWLLGRMAIEEPKKPVEEG